MVASQLTTTSILLFSLAALVGDGTVGGTRVDCAVHSEWEE